VLGCANAQPKNHLDQVKSTFSNLRAVVQSWCIGGQPFAPARCYPLGTQVGTTYTGVTNPSRFLQRHSQILCLALRSGYVT
jgi:hypothetical protein